MQTAPSDMIPKAQYDAVLGAVAQLRHQLEWFRRQLFGTKSDKRLVEQTPIKASSVKSLLVLATTLMMHNLMRPIRPQLLQATSARII